MNRTSWWAQALQNKLIALVLAMVAIVPLLAAPADGWESGSAALVVEAFAIVLLATLLWRIRWNASRASVTEFLKTGANTPVLIFLAIAVVSCLFSSHKSYSIQETMRIGAGVLLYFVAAYQFRRSEHLTKLVDVLVFVAIAVSLAGFVQFGMADEQRAGGLFGNPQLFASFLVVLLPLIAAVALTERSPNRQLAAQTATVLMIAGILLSQTRSAWSATAAGVAALVFIVFAMTWRNRRAALGTRKHETVLPVMLLVVAVGFFVLIAPQTDAFLQRGSTLSNLGSDSTWQTRQYWYQGAFAMIKERPLTGFGVGLFPYYQSQYSGMGRPLDLFGRRASMTELAHNFYLQTAAELGIPALIALLAGLFIFLISGIRRARGMDAGIRRTLLIGAMAAMVAFGVDAIASPSWQFGQTAMFFWLILGVGVGCLRPQQKAGEEALAPSPSARLLRPASAFSSLALAALLPSIAFAHHLGYIHPCKCDITPKNKSIRGGTKLDFTLMVLFCDNHGGSVWEDVTLETGGVTHFSQLGGRGVMGGINKRHYESRVGENDRPVITGTYKLPHETPQACSTNLFVHYP